jgi:hypothetical protein
MEGVVAVASAAIMAFGLKWLLNLMIASVVEQYINFWDHLYIVF